jgi:type II secretory ATPase GspE/PulE/Tfp pilus assembly ATPase PilB-like protein
MSVWRETGKSRLYGSGLRQVQQDRVQGPGWPARIVDCRRRCQKLIQERARVAELFAAAVEGGMRTLKMDGMEKVMMG